MKPSDCPVIYLEEYTDSPERDYFFFEQRLVEGDTVKYHRHDFYECLVVISGCIIEKCNGVKTSLTKQQGHFLSPRDCHEISGGSEGENILRCISVRREKFESALKRSGLSDERLYRYFMMSGGAFMAYQTKAELTYDLWCEGKEHDYLLDTILSDLFISAILAPSEGDAPPWLSRAYRLMEKEENFTQGLDRLLELCGRSQEYVTRAFHRYYGITPTEYINRLRLRQAAYLIKSTDLKIIDILYRCGFNNVSYFNRLFKTRYHQTPAEYRSNKSPY